MAKYKVLQGGAGNTTINGTYAFTLKTGDIVDGAPSGDGKFVLVALSYLAPNQSNPPQAKFKSKYLQLIPSAAPAIAVSSIASATNAPASDVPQKKVATDISKYYPFIGIAAGSIGGFLVAKENHPTVAKYATWIVILGGVGGVLGIVLTKVLAKKAPEKSSKVASGTGSTVASPVQVTDTDINQLIDSLISKNIKDAAVNSSNGAQVKSALATLSDKEKSILYDMLNVYDELPAFPTTQQISDLLPKLSALSDKYGADFANLSLKLNAITAATQAPKPKKQQVQQSGINVVVSGQPSVVGDGF